MTYPLLKRYPHCRAKLPIHHYGTMVAAREMPLHSIRRTGS